MDNDDDEYNDYYYYNYYEDWRVYEAYMCVGDAGPDDRCDGGSDGYCAHSGPYCYDGGSDGWGCHSSGDEAGECAVRCRRP